MKMMSVKWWLLLLAIPVVEGSLGLEKPQGFSVEERVMEKILETCYGDNDFKDLIFILGDFDGVFDKASVIRMNNLLSVDEEYESRQLLNIGVTQVLIIEDSPERLHSDLISFRKTRWWNHMLPFFIIGKNDEKCENFNEMLNTTWRMEILNSIYICSESENTTLYTLNPITNYAPDPWKRMEDLDDTNIYRQIFNPHTSCNNLNYDKTKVLNGYKIQLILSVPPYDDEDPMNLQNSVNLLYLIVFIGGQCNVSLSFELVFGNDPGHQLKEHEADVIFYELKAVGAIRGSPLYFRPETQCVVLVKFNERTLLYKVRHLWSTQVLCASAISLIILYFILRMKNDGVTSAILDGEIVALLMESNEVSPVKTIGELNDLGYHFYVISDCEGALSKLHLPESKVKLTEHNSCIQYALNDPLVTCIIPEWLYAFTYGALPESLSYIRVRAEIFHPLGWTSRRDWPIHERFDSMLSQIFESGTYVVEFFNREFNADEFNRIINEANDDELTMAKIESPYRQIKLADLNLAFKFLAIGLSFAMCVLIVELRMREI